MGKDRDTNFQEHSVFLSEIAEQILNGNNKILSIPGVPEIIALYLLVPYITNTQFDMGMSSKVPQLDLLENFSDEINLKNLRDALCHSFVSVEESTEIRKGRIILDDRAGMKRDQHDKQQIKTKAACIEIEHANAKLKELHKKVIDSIKPDSGI
jgi:hypothetical protein